MFLSLARERKIVHNKISSNVRLSGGILMYQNDLIIADKDLRILYMGDNIISTVIKKNLSRPIGYPSGHLMENNTFSVFIWDASSLSDAVRSVLESTCGEILPEKGPVIIAGVFPGKEEKSLVKIPSQNDFISGTLIDTVFHGCRLKLTYAPSVPITPETAIAESIMADPCSTVSFLINDQQVSLHKKSYDDIIIVLSDDSGITYYGRPSDLTSFFTGGRYPSYIDSDRLRNEAIHLYHVADRDILHGLLKAAEENTSQIIKSLGNTCLISFFRITDWNSPSDHFFIWKVTAISDLLWEMRDHSRDYIKLVKSRQDQISGGSTFSLWGTDSKISRIRYLLQKAAGTNTTILLTGESGTGKTFLAKEIHRNSMRQDKPFVHVNCAAIPYNLIESELFGYEDGAFTGAKKGGKAGYFEIAQGGTLFLEEITEMPMSLQGKLLEVLQDKTYFRVGGEKKKRADVRLIAATNRNLSELVVQRLFREDLYYRINVFPVEIPPLRDRMDSLLAIVTILLPEICERLGIRQQMLSMEALDKMKRYKWPGNIRELENIIEKACILSDGYVIKPEDVDIDTESEFYSPDEGSLSPENHSLFAQRDAFEKQLIIKTLEQFNGSRTKAAVYLGIGKTSLFDKLKKYGIIETAGHKSGTERDTE